MCLVWGWGWGFAFFIGKETSLYLSKQIFIIALPRCIASRRVVLWASSKTNKNSMRSLFAGDRSQSREATTTATTTAATCCTRRGALVQAICIQMLPCGTRNCNRNHTAGGRRRRRRRRRSKRRQQRKVNGKGGGRGQGSAAGEATVS